MVRAIAYIILTSLLYVGCSDDTIDGRNISPPLITAYSVEEALRIQSNNPGTIVKFILDLRGQRLDSISYRVGDIEFLVKILADDNMLTDLPSSLAKEGSVRDLFDLYLRGNRFNELPVVLMRLHQPLFILSLAGNRLQLIDTSYSLLFVNDSVDLSFNEISSWPDGVTIGGGVRRVWNRDSVTVEMPKVLDLRGNPLPLDDVEKARRLMPNTKILF